MIVDYFELDYEPFRLTPNPEINFRHRSYQKALSYIKYAINRREGILVITGEPGTGKTSIIEEVESVLSKSRIRVVKTVAHQFRPAELMTTILHDCQKLPDNDLQVATGLTLAEQLIEFENLLLAYKDSGNYVLLLIDETQMLPTETLDFVRQLANLQSDREPLLQIIIFGQNELLDIVNVPELEQFKQRVVASCQLTMLESEEDVYKFVCHQFTHAGGNEHAISEDISKTLLEASRGNPRLVNQIMNRLLLYSMTKNTKHISVESLEEILEELKYELLMKLS